MMSAFNEARRGRNIRRAVLAFETHVEHCRRCYPRPRGYATKWQACALGRSLWRVVELRTERPYANR